jgi:putative addiction module component (TIGR02574 family)
MSLAVHDLYRKAAELTIGERMELAALLLESVEPADAGEVERAWATEIERRMAEYRAGRMKTIPWSEVRAGLYRR